MTKPLAYSRFAQPFAHAERFGPYMNSRKTWFVSYRLDPRPVRAGHARTSETFASEAEAKSFARELPSAVSDITAGTINPHVPKKFYGSADIFKWLADDPSGVDPEGN